MEVCSASPVICRYLTTVYTKPRSGFTARLKLAEHAGLVLHLVVSVVWMFWRLQGHRVWMTPVLCLM